MDTRLLRDLFKPQGGHAVPHGRTTQAIISGAVLLVFTSQHLAAQTSYENSAAGGQNEEPQVLESETVPGTYREVYPDVMPGYAGASPPPTGMDQIRQYPHPAPQWAATHAYPNYDFPDYMFGIWFRPQGWGLTKRERCAIPDPWRPRGKGNLFARPSTPHRMDYNREVVVHPYTSYGPSYYVRQPDPRCCVRTKDGHIIYRNSRKREAQLQERLRDATQVRIR